MLPFINTPFIFHKQYAHNFIIMHKTKHYFSFITSKKIRSAKNRAAVIYILKLFFTIFTDKHNSQHQKNSKRRKMTCPISYMLISKAEICSVQNTAEHQKPEYHNKRYSDNFISTHIHQSFVYTVFSISKAKK